jgi:hypothetical protein
MSSSNNDFLLRSKAQDQTPFFTIQFRNCIVAIFDTEINNHPGKRYRYQANEKDKIKPN